MSAPFAPGDVVVCVDDRRSYTATGGLSTAKINECGSFLRKCRLYRVAAVDCRLGTLRLDGDPIPPFYEGGYNARRFRKIDDEVTEDFRAQLKSLSKPKERAKC